MSRSTNQSSINCPIVICLPTVCYFSREKTLVKPTAPGSSSSYICLAIYFFFAFYSDLLNPKTQKYIAALYFICDLLFQSITIFSRLRANFWRRTRKGLTTPLTRRVASGCYLCAGAVYVLFLGSPTGSIPWFHYWGKYLPLSCYIILSSWGKHRRSLGKHHQGNFWRRCRGGSST